MVAFEWLTFFFCPPSYYTWCSRPVLVAVSVLDGFILCKVQLGTTENGAEIKVSLSLTAMRSVRLVWYLFARPRTSVKRQWKGVCFEFLQTNHGQLQSKKDYSIRTTMNRYRTVVLGWCKSWKYVLSREGSQNYYILKWIMEWKW